MNTTPLRDAQHLPALLPCPFCGKGPEKLEKQYGDESGYIRCRNCGAQSGRVFWTDEERESDDFSKSEAEAVAAWNRRAAIAAQPAPEAGPVPTVWVRRNGGFTSGVAHFGPECPPGWTLAAEPFYAAPVAQQPAALTDAEIASGVAALRPSTSSKSMAHFWFTNGARFAERAHGIPAATQAPTTDTGEQR